MGKKAQVLLLKPLSGRGNAGDIVDLSIHYVNQVIAPQGIGMFFDKQAKNQHSAQLKKIAKAKEEHLSALKAVIDALVAQGGFAFSKQATESEKLYDSIDEKTLVHYIEHAHHIHVDKKCFHLEAKIEALGTYTVVFKSEGIEQELPIVVTKAH
jgi:ribosomal protein L9